MLNNSLLIRVEFISSFCNMVELGIFQLSLDEIPGDRRVNPGIMRHLCIPV